jgi:methylated-DNA-[protein]-cysteine S-methyltransferase
MNKRGLWDLVKSLPAGTIYYATMDSPWGKMLLADKGKGLFLLKLNIDKSSKSEDFTEEDGNIKISRNDAYFESLKQQLNEYFEGKRTQFDWELDISTGTEFQQKVWQAMKKIPYGKSLSYGELARKIGKPKASRAVGNACAKNPIPILIPCHRVLGSQGKLGGFSAGLMIKKALLDREKIPFKTLKKAD